MAVAQDHRPVGAHPVDVLVAVDVPHPRALRAGEKAGMVLAEGRPVLVAVDAARHDAPGALPERETRGLSGGQELHGAGMIAPAPAPPTSWTSARARGPARSRSTGRPGR